jgi:hypothetical protein
MIPRFAIDVARAPAGNARGSVSAARAMWGERRTPGAAVWRARPLPILINRDISAHALDERLDHPPRLLYQLLFTHPTPPERLAAAG